MYICCKNHDEQTYNMNTKMQAMFEVITTFEFQNALQSTFDVFRPALLMKHIYLKMEQENKDESKEKKSKPNRH